MKIDWMGLLVLALLISIIGGLLWFGRAVATGRIDANSKRFRAGYQVFTLAVAISMGWGAIKRPTWGHVLMFAGWGLVTAGYWSVATMRLAKPLGELSAPPQARGDQRLVNLGTGVFLVGVVCWLAQV
jgi:hypothetical protein